MTNCALVGFVSHGLLFYFPDLDPIQRVPRPAPPRPAPPRPAPPSV